MKVGRLIGISLVLGALHVWTGDELQRTIYRGFRDEVATYGTNSLIHDRGNEVRITVGGTGPRETRIGLEGIASESTERMLDALELELSRAPGFYTNECDLNDVRIMHGMEHDTEKIDGFYTHGTIYLDTDAPNPHTVVVHELNHLCVDTNRGLFSLEWNTRFNALTGTRYVGDGWRRTQEREFARDYGSKDWLEDVATVAEDVLSHKRYPDRSGDGKYRSKRALVRGFYHRLGHPDFKDAESGGR